MVAVFLLLAPACRGGREPPPSGEVLRIAIRQPSSIDSATLRDHAGLLVARQVFEPLAKIDEGTLEPRPLSARWEILDGGTRFIFRINDEQRFHNGLPVTADDAAFALNRLVKKETSSDFAYLLSDVAGFDEVYNRGELTDLPGIRVLDAKTLEIQLTNPWMGFPYVMSHPATAPIPRADFEADPAGFREHPVGSGPYRVTEPVRTGSDFMLEAAPRSGRAASSIKRIEFHVYEQSLRAWLDVDRGRVDIAEVPPAEIRAARARYGDEGFVPVAGMMYIGFNLMNPNLQDVRLRRAISLAIDRDSIASSVYGSTMRPARELLPTRLPGGVDESCGDDCSYDVQGARALVGEAFPGGSPELAFDYPMGSVDQSLAEVLKQSLAEVGLTLNLRGHEPTEFIEFVDASSQEIYRLGWAADYPSPEWFLYPLFATGRPDNTTGFSSPEVDDLLSRARGSVSRSERFAFWREAERKILDAMPVVPIGQFESHLAAVRAVHGLRVDMLGTFSVATMSIDLQ